MPNPKWLKSAVFYQVYPQSYYDSNNDGIGDIPGIIKKLDYIKSLGCNAVWVNPCFVSPFGDAGYDVADFCKVAPRYGANADLKRLFSEAKRKGIRIILDLVAGHTSIEHPWFKASSTDKQNKYSDYYIWTKHAFDTGGGKVSMIAGLAGRNGQFMNNYFYFQPALNYGFARPDPHLNYQQSIGAPGPVNVKREMKKIMRFWLDMGASGFRVDMAASLVKLDYDSSATSKFWKEVREMFDRYYPEAVLISEWGDPLKSLKANFHIDFLLHFSTAAKTYLSLFRRQENSIFSRASKGNIRDFLDDYMKMYKGTRKNGYIAIPSGNHDMSRLNHNMTAKELEIMFAFLLTMPGVPFIYYGDEIGMRFLEGLPSKEGGFGRTGARTPMQWSNAKNAGFSKADKKKIYLPVDGSRNRPTVENQENDPSSLLNKVREFNELRKTSPALQADGDFMPVYAEKNRYPFVYLRRKGDQAFVIALNPSKYNVKVKISPKLKGELVHTVNSKATIAKIKGSYTLRMPPQSYAIYEAIR